MDPITALANASQPPLLAPAPYLSPGVLGGAIGRLGAGPCAVHSSTPTPTTGALEPTLQSLLLLLVQLMAPGPRAANAAPSGAGGDGLSAASAGGSGGASSTGGSSSAGGSSSTSASSASASPGKVSASGFTPPLDSYKTTSGFGSRTSPTTGKPDSHGGLDMAAPSGTPIKAAKAGVVSVSQDDSGGFGKWVEIRHADGGKTRYAHMSERGTQVGQQVQAGQVIGKVGSTGNSTGPHLHFEVLKADGSKVDPRTVLA